MSDDEIFNAPDADIILRALGPPNRDFRVHKLVLSLASSMFKDMFSLPRPTSGSSGVSPGVAEVEIIEVTDPPDALDIVLRMIYPGVTPPSCEGDLDPIVECLVIADKYDIKGVKLQLHDALAQANPPQPLKVYAIATRFGFADLVDSASCDIHSSIHLTRISELPNYFDFVPATVYHQLVRYRANYLEAVVKMINKTPLRLECDDCPMGKAHTKGRDSTWAWDSTGEGGSKDGRSTAEEMFRLRLTHLIMTGTPVEARTCLGALAKTYGYNARCKQDCILKFIRSAISRVDKDWVKPVATPRQGGALKKAVAWVLGAFRG